MVDRQNAGGGIGIGSRRVVETGGFRALHNLHAAGLLGDGAGGSLGFTVGQNEVGERPRIVDAENVLDLGEGRAVGLLIFVHFAGGLAAVAPVADEELSAAAGGDLVEIPVDASGGMSGPGGAGEVEVLEAIGETEDGAVGGQGAGGGLAAGTEAGDGGDAESGRAAGRGVHEIPGEGFAGGSAGAGEGIVDEDGGVSRVEIEGADGAGPERAVGFGEGGRGGGGGGGGGEFGVGGILEEATSVEERGL